MAENSTEYNPNVFTMPGSGKYMRGFLCVVTMLGVAILFVIAGVAAVGLTQNPSTIDFATELFGSIAASIGGIYGVYGIKKEFFSPS